MQKYPNDFVLPQGNDWLVVTIVFDDILVEDTFIVEQTTIWYGEIGSWYDYEVTLNERLQELI